MRLWPFFSPRAFVVCIVLRLTRLPIKVKVVSLAMLNSTLCDARKVHFPSLTVLVLSLCGCKTIDYPLLMHVYWIWIFSIYCDTREVVLYSQKSWSNKQVFFLTCTYYGYIFWSSGSYMPPGVLVIVPIAHDCCVMWFMYAQMRIALDCVKYDWFQYYIKFSLRSANATFC